MHSHVGDNIIYWKEMCNIRAILKQSLIVSMYFRSPYSIIFFCNIILENYFLNSLKHLKSVKKILIDHHYNKSCQNFWILSHLSESIDVPAGC